MSGVTDCSVYLRDFVNRGFVGNLSELRSLSEDEFRALVTAIHGTADCDTHPVAATQAFRDFRKQTLEERILGLKSPPAALPISDALEKSRWIVRGFLDAYVTGAKPRVIGSVDKRPSLKCRHIYKTTLSSQLLSLHHFFLRPIHSALRQKRAGKCMPQMITMQSLQRLDTHNLSASWSMIRWHDSQVEAPTLAPANELSFTGIRAPGDFSGYIAVPVRSDSMIEWRQRGTLQFSTAVAYPPSYN
jgi:hypothetical protein